MLMRICLGVCSPGGPCAFEFRGATKDVATGITFQTVIGTVKSLMLFAASESLSEIVLEVVCEWTAQCAHSSIGRPKAASPKLGLEAGSCSVESICM
jgi:hypothetical protein